MNDTTDLGSLSKGREKRAITARVVRKWTVKEDFGKGQPLFVGLVLADAKGNALYAEISKEVIPTKEYLLDLGKVYVIKKFKVHNAKSAFRAVDRNLMMEIIEYTSIELAREYPPTIPEYVYSLTPFASIVPAGKTVVNYIDVLGYITEYTALETFPAKNQGKVVNLRKLCIKDLSDKALTVTLWGEDAINFSIDGVYNEAVGNIVVCLLVGCVPRRDYKEYDKVYLSASSAFASYLNPQITDAAPFYSRFKDTPIYIDRPAQTGNPAPAAVIANPLKMMTIHELHAIEDPFDFEDGTYKCAVTITSISTNMNWWYMSCKRHKRKAVQQDDHVYRCLTCNGSDTMPRYLLSFTAKDETGEANFFAYDDEASVIVGKDCETIMNPLAQAQGLPQPLQNIVDKRYVFSIALSDSAWRQYVVKAVLEKPSRRPVQPHLTPSRSEIQTAANLLIEAVSVGAPLAIAENRPLVQTTSSIETTSHTTPVTPAEVHGTSSKTDTSRPSDISASVRRNLATAFQVTDQIGTAGPEDSQTTLNSDAITPHDVAPPKPKRSKSANTKTSSSDLRSSQR